MKQKIKTVEKINETKSWFFERVNKISKPLARLIKQKRERIQIKPENGRGGITADTTDIQRVIKKCCDDNLDVMDKFLETHNLPR